MSNQRVGRFCHYTAFCIAVFFIPHIVAAENSVEDEVKAFFADAPVMVDIARCESKFRQFQSDGSPLRGGWGGGMIGVFQIYESVHKSAATALGLDITTLEGNLAYARHLYTSSGTTPWNGAKACWEKHADAADIEALQAKIRVLQKLVAQLEHLLALKNTV